MEEQRVVNRIKRWVWKEGMMLSTQKKMREKANEGKEKLERISR